jgi:hypothetical protein
VKLIFNGKSLDVDEVDRKLPAELQAKAVAHLRSVLTPEALAYLRAFHARCPGWTGDETSPEERERIRERYDGFYVPTPFHFSTGMAIRNVLREVIKDDELPPVEYAECFHNNWDDYYVAVLDEAVR